MSATPTTLQGNRKKINKMNKTELQEEVKIHRKNEAQYKENLINLRKKINEIKEELKELRLLKEKYSLQDNLTTRMIANGKWIVEQEQYSGRETLELVGLPDNTTQQTFAGLQDMSLRRLQHVFSVTILRLPRRLEDVLRTRLEDVLKTFSRPLARRLMTLGGSF